jgi:hypothetical protein
MAVLEHIEHVLRMGFRRTWKEGPDANVQPLFWWFCFAKP